MGANRIAGLTIEVGGDTTKLNKALAGTNKEIKDTQAQLRDVEKLLKADPSNIELLEQKQRLLAGAVENTKSKLEQLKDAEKQVQDQFAKGEISQAQYDGLQREIIATEEDLKSLEKAAASSNAKMQEVAATAEKISSVSGKVASAMMPATLAITGLGAVSLKYASDTQEALNKTRESFKDASGQVEDFAETSLEMYGISEGTALDMASLFGDMGTSMGIPTQAAADMSTNLVGLAGDLASFKNIGLDETQTALASVFTGETESMRRLGVVMTQTNLDAYCNERCRKRGDANRSRERMKMMRRIGW